MLRKTCFAITCVKAIGSADKGLHTFADVTYGCSVRLAPCRFKKFNGTLHARIPWLSALILFLKELNVRYVSVYFLRLNFSRDLVQQDTAMFAYSHGYNRGLLLKLSLFVSAFNCM